jgi:hypothetical protein
MTIEASIANARNHPPSPGGRARRRRPGTLARALGAAAALAAVALAAAACEGPPADDLAAEPGPKTAPATVGVTARALESSAAAGAEATVSVPKITCGWVWVCLPAGDENCIYRPRWVCRP